jgi:hypothetical protein
MRAMVLHPPHQPLCMEERPDLEAGPRKIASLAWRDLPDSMDERDSTGKPTRRRAAG